MKALPRPADPLDAGAVPDAGGFLGLRLPDAGPSLGNHGGDAGVRYGRAVPRGQHEQVRGDDEAEAEHKRKIKEKRLAKRGAKTGQHSDINISRGGRERGRVQGNGSPVWQDDETPGINYDDGEDFGPYKLLSRPASYAQTIGRFEAPQEERSGSYRGRRGRGFSTGLNQGNRNGRGGRNNNNMRDMGLPRT